MNNLPSILASSNNGPYVPPDVIDANFVTDYGANPFYRRLWYGEIATSGTTVTVASGGIDASYIGLKIYIKHTRVGSKTPYGTYFTITGVTNATTFTVNTAPQYNVVNEAGYIFFDNTTAYRAAIAAGNASGKVWNIYVPNGTYVIPNYNLTVNTGGGFKFIGDMGIDGYGMATFKILPEETRSDYNAFVYIASVANMGAWEMAFKNVNLVARDNYSYDTTNLDAIFKFPNSGTPTASPKVTLTNCNMAAEFDAFYADVTHYIQNKYGTDADTIKTFRLLEWLWARPQLLKINVFSDGVNDAIYTLDNCEVHVTQFFTVGNSVYLRPTDKLTFIQKNTNARGSVNVGRQGVVSNDLLKPIVNIVADENGDFTKVVFDETSPLFFNTQTLAQQYDTYARKRTGSFSIYCKISGITQREILTNNIKKTTGIPQYLGEASSVYSAGSDVYYIIIDTIACSEDIGNTAGAFERAGGVTQFDDIGSNNGGAYSEIYPTGANASLNTLEGFLKDYKGWVRYNFGDGGQTSQGQPADPLGEDVRKLRVCLAYNDTPAYAVADTVRVERPVSLTLTITGGTKKIIGYYNSQNNAFNHIKIDGVIYDCTLGVIEQISPSLFHTNITIAAFSTDGTYSVKMYDTLVIDQIQPLTGFGNMVALKTLTGLVPYTYAGFTVSKDSVIHKADFTVDYGQTKFGFSVKKTTGSSVISVGQKLYAWFMGTGNAATGNFVQTRYQPNYFYLHKWDAPATAQSLLTLEWLCFQLNGEPIAGEVAAGATHWLYGADSQTETILYDWQNVNLALNADLNEEMSLVFRRGNGRSGSLFKNCNLPHQEQGSPTKIINGGTMTGIGAGTVLQTRNNPILTGTVTSATITALDGTGYTLNGTFIPS